MTRNKSKGSERADEIALNMTQESGSATSSQIAGSNITGIAALPTISLPTPPASTNEPLSDDFGSLVDSHISAGWIDAHTMAHSHLLPRVPLCRLLANPAIRTNDDCVADLVTSVAERGYQPTMSRFIISEAFPGQEPLPFDRRGVQGRELIMSAHFDDELRTINELQHMEEKMFVVWDGNHRLNAWKEWALREKLDEHTTPRVECTIISFSPHEMAEFLLVLGMINK